MTNEERQAVIDALQYADGCRYCRAKIAAALAIMRKDAEQAAKDAESHAEQQAIAARNRAVIAHIYGD